MMVVQLDYVVNSRLCNNVAISVCSRYMALDIPHGIFWLVARSKHP